jgi:hypothetical protein
LEVDQVEVAVSSSEDVQVEVQKAALGDEGSSFQEAVEEVHSEVMVETETFLAVIHPVASQLVGVAVAVEVVAAESFWKHPWFLMDFLHRIQMVHLQIALEVTLAEAAEVVEAE